MKRTNALIRGFFPYLAVLMLSACGGSGDGDSVSSTRAADGGDGSALTTLSGVVADGYLREARVFLDRNGNYLYDNGEPMASSGPGGAYSMEVSPGEGDLYPVVAEVIAGLTLDEDTGTVVTNGFFLQAPPKRWEFISPLTTLVKQEMDKNPSFTEQQAVVSVRSQLGIADDVSMFRDYLAPGPQTDALLAEYSRTHKAARVVAGLLGILRVEIAANLGGQIDAAEQKLVEYMVSDQILSRAVQIRQAFEAEKNFGTPVDVAVLTATVSTEIEPENLDADLLALYEQRILQGLDTWDMQPPQLLQQSPPADDTASVDVIVSAGFDETLDPTLIAAGIIELYGPHGLVAGHTDFDPEQHLISFTPDQVLLSYSEYQVRVKGQLADSIGNPLGDDVVWSFRTVFDMLPPVLPDF